MIHYHTAASSHEKRAAAARRRQHHPLPLSPQSARVAVTSSSPQSSPFPNRRHCRRRHRHGHVLGSLLSPSIGLRRANSPCQAWRRSREPLSLALPSQALFHLMSSAFETAPPPPPPRSCPRSARAPSHRGRRGAFSRSSSPRPASSFGLPLGGNAGGQVGALNGVPFVLPALTHANSLGAFYCSAKRSTRLLD